MKQLLLKYAPLFIAITALADTQFDLLIQIGLTETAIAWVKLLGLLTALFLPSLKESFKRKESTKDCKDTECLEDLKQPLKVKNVIKSGTNNTSVFLNNSNTTFTDVTPNDINPENQTLENLDPFNTNVPTKKF